MCRHGKGYRVDRKNLGERENPRKSTFWLWECVDFAHNQSHFIKFTPFSRKSLNFFFKFPVWVRVEEKMSLCENFVKKRGLNPWILRPGFSKRISTHKSIFFSIRALSRNQNSAFVNFSKISKFKWLIDLSCR